MLPNKYFYDLFFILLLFLVQCSTYQPLKSKGLPYNSIHIKHLQNKTHATEVNALFADAVRKQIIEKSSLSIVEKEEADVVLELYLVLFEESSSATQRSDPTRAQSYTFQFLLEANLWDNRTQKYHFYKKTFNDSENVRNDFLKDSSAKYQKMPVLVDRLINQVVTDIINPWL